jgi:Ca2+/H+ antiporter
MPGVVVHACNPRRLKQEDCEFEASLGYVARPGLTVSLLALVAFFLQPQLPLYFHHPSLFLLLIFTLAACHCVITAGFTTVFAVAMLLSLPPPVTVLP